MLWIPSTKAKLFTGQDACASDEIVILNSLDQVGFFEAIRVPGKR